MTGPGLGGAGRDTEGMRASEQSPAISVDRLSKRFASQQVLDELTLSVAKGEIFGLVGPKGAGKTTTLRILATLSRADSGTATVAGVAVDQDPSAARRAFGYLPARWGVPRRQTATEYLEFFAAIHGVGRSRCRRLAEELIELLDLSDRADDYVESLDEGNKRRLGLARTLVHDPAVLLLDEPLSGLDAHADDELRRLISDLGRTGKTVLITARRPGDADGLCSSVGVLDGGRLAEDGSVDEAETVGA